jgi:hypothetical protein
MTLAKRRKSAQLSHSVQRQAPTSDTSEVPGVATLLERRRCDVLSRHVARIATEHQLVRDLRDLMFGGPTQTVALDRALALLDSPATHYLSPEWFRFYGVPFAVHEAVKGGERVMTPGAHRRERRVRVTVKWPAREISTEVDVLVDDRDGRSALQRIEVPGRFGARTFPVFRNTWLEVLKLYCAQFCGDLLWSEAEAVAFVMMGEPPEIKPVRAAAAIARDTAGQPIRTEVTIRVQPFVSIDSIDRMLAAVRVLLGRRLRPGPAMAQRTLALFEFVEERRADAESKVPPWAELVEAWDNAHRRDRWGYGGDRRNFKRDYERSRRLLLEDYLPPREYQEMLATQRKTKRMPGRPRR